MEEQGHIASQENLLAIDVDAIVAEGKKEAKRKIAITISLAIVLIASGIFGVIWYQKETIYQKAIETEYAEHYEEAISLFESLGGYRDSVNRISDIIMTQDVLYQEAILALETEDYKAAISKFQKVVGYKDSQRLLEESNEANNIISSQVFETLANNARASKGYSIEIRYDRNSRTITVSSMISSDEESRIMEEEIGPSDLALWCLACDNYDQITKEAHVDFSAIGFNVDCIYSVKSESGEILYSTTNGTSTYSRINMEEAIANAYEEIYVTVVAFVDNGQYDSACNYWNNIASTSKGFFTLNYKELSDYFYYASALKNYTHNGTMRMGEYISALNQVSPTFKDTQKRLETVSIRGVLPGTYIKDDSTILQSRYFRITIGADDTFLMEFIIVGRIYTSEYNLISDATKYIDWVMVNGKPSYAIIKGYDKKERERTWVVTIKPDAQGLEVEALEYGKYDSRSSGVYK